LTTRRKAQRRIAITKKELPLDEPPLQHWTRNIPTGLEEANVPAQDLYGLPTLLLVCSYEPAIFLNTTGGETSFKHLLVRKRGNAIIQHLPISDCGWLG
jgi:hypothetical protein